jgi:hypothetical protein
MRGSVGEPHSDQRDHSLPATRMSDGFVRGHRLWIAVKLWTLDNILFLRGDGLCGACGIVDDLVFP